MMFILLALSGYLIGSVPSGFLSMRLFTGRDIRSLGTGSATVTAVMIHGGKRPGVVALVLEIIKTIICIVIAHYLVGEVWATLVILVAAVVGCNWSIWLKGSGGQGLTIGVFGLFLLNPLPILIMAVFYLLPMLITKRHVLSNRLFRLSLPVILGLWYGSWEWPLAGCLIVVPSFIKEWLFGDDVVDTRKTGGVSQAGNEA